MTGGRAAVEDDPIAGLTAAQAGDGVVDAFERDVFRHRRDAVSEGELEHPADGRGAADRRGGDALLSREQREHGDVDRLQRGADEVQPAPGVSGCPGRRSSPASR